ncbi:MAG TPA: DNRLRE domain-containing protein, partial [Pirellulales bacterium]|nr:DNRLRE domain-containing protein [Pirellulales bacterium]
ISLNPVADAFVSSANPDNNYGGAGALEVSAAGLPKGQFESLLQFDLSSAKNSFDSTFGAGHWSVQSVSLQLTAASPNSSLFNTLAAGQFAVSWMQNDSWMEGTGTPAAPGSTGITFNSLPSFLSASDQSLGTFIFSGSTSATASYSLTLASGLSGDVVTGGLTSLLLEATDTTMSGLFNSRSFTTVASRPLLTINAVAVPEPASWILAALGVGGMIVLGHRLARSSTFDRLNGEVKCSV